MGNQQQNAVQQSTNNKAIADTRKRLATMSPDQRKMMEDMLANPGVGMSGGNQI
ncbi:MAG: hypothetical protein Q8M25_21935 [Rhodoferax sp.]|nr:hypothetical protein [Rhodoferax sp.]